jgi:hypothetical protein
MLIVADTSALLALAACECLDLLDVLFREVRVPPAVFRECTKAGKPGADILGTYFEGAGGASGPGGVRDRGRGARAR